MIAIETIINNIKTDLEAKTWPTSDGGGSMSFKAVFTYPNYNHAKGSPFVVLGDDTAVGQMLDNKTVQFNHTIEIQLCTNWDSIDAQETDLKVKETIRRMRTAWDWLKGYAVKESTHIVWFGNNYSQFFAGIETETIQNNELNLIMKVVRLGLVEPVRTI